MSDSRIAGLLSPIHREIAAKRGIRPVLEAMDRAKEPLCARFHNNLKSSTVTRALTLKVLNLCLAKYHFLARSTSLLSRPYGLEVDPINNCNLACPGCVHSTHVKEQGLFQWNSGMLSEARYSALLRRYGPYAIQTTLCNYGEPLLNPLTPKFIRLAKSYLMSVTLSTNMTAKRFDAEAYADSGLDFMTVSLDGATQDVYEKFRRKGDLEMAFANLRSLVEAKRRLARKTPVISWQFLAFEHNAHEIDAACEKARALGVDQFTVATPFDVSWDDPSIKPANVTPFTRVFHANSEQIRAANWNPCPDELAAAAIDREFETTWTGQLASAPRDIEREHHGSPNVCHWLYKNMVMDATGRVIPCCAAPRPDADLVFASFSEDAPEAFNSEKYRLARLSFADKQAYAAERPALPLGPDPHCVSCDWYSDQAAAQIDTGQVRNYFGIAGNGLFDSKTVGLLSDW